MTEGQVLVAETLRVSPLALSAAEQEAIAARVTELRDGLIYSWYFTAFGNASVKFDANSTSDR